MVRYIVDQSTDSPIRRHTSSNACSSRSVSRWHSSTKLRLEMGTWSVPGLAGGTNDGS